jgi:hypothetical protein
MLSLLLWPILAVWMGLAFVVLALIVGVLGYGAARLAWDRRGVEDEVWCPVHRRRMHVLAIPSRFVRVPIRDLRRCERFGTRHIVCGKWCVHGESLVKAARTN